MDKHKLTRHHVVPRSRNGSNDPDNILKLRKNIHTAFHIIFHNDTPDEQLIRLLSMNSSVLRWEYKQQIRDIINNWEKDCYKHWILKR